MPDAQQREFNADMVEKAKAFRLTPDQFNAIRASSHPEAALQQAMVAYLWHAKFAEVQAKMGCYLMPTWVETYIGHAWSDHSADFMDAAYTAYGLAAAERITA